MEQNKLRRIPIAQARPRDVWLQVTANTEWVQFDTLLGRWSAQRSVWAPRLLYWGGLAGIVGGVLWIILVFIPQWKYVMDEPSVYPEFSEGIPFYLGSSLLALPLALFLIGSLGRYAWQWQTRGRSRSIGLFLTWVGLILTLIDTVYQGWLRDLNTYIFGYRLHGLFQTPRPPFWLWLHHNWFSFLVACVGLGILGIPVLFAKGPPSGLGLLVKTAPVWLVLGPILCLSVPVALSLIPSLNNYYAEKAAAVFDPLTTMALLFGAGWIWLGRKLVSASSTDSIQPNSTGASL